MHHLQHVLFLIGGDHQSVMVTRFTAICGQSLEIYMCDLWPTPQVLNSFHNQKTLDGIEEMLYRLYAPILWRSLTVSILHAIWCPHAQ